MEGEEDVMAKEDRIGALWRRENPNGPVAKGSIELNGQRVNIVVWRNKWKAEDLQSQDSAVREQAHKKPDLYIEIDKPRDGYAGQQTSQAQRPQPQRDADGRAFESDEDIPF